jgi:hypothetical protein
VRLTTFVEPNVKKSGGLNLLLNPRGPSRPEGGRDLYFYLYVVIVLVRLLSEIRTLAAVKILTLCVIVYSDTVRSQHKSLATGD